jgi:hypothetical protein
MEVPQKTKKRADHGGTGGTCLASQLFGRWWQEDAKSEAKSGKDSKTLSPKPNTNKRTCLARVRPRAEGPVPPKKKQMKRKKLPYVNRNFQSTGHVYSKHFHP